MLLMEIAAGTIDGVNRVFTTSHYYVTGSVRAFAPLLQNGLEVTELGGNRVQLADAPLEGDVVYLTYRSV